jgi:hypothetical protein
MSGPFGSTAWMANPSSGFYDFEISNSLRFDTASSTYLEKDSYTHNRQIFTYSFWFKPTNPTVRQFIFGRYIDGNNVSVLEYDGGEGGRLSWYDYQSGAYTFQQRTSALHRDVSAWYHVVLRVDTTDGTAGNRARMYVNGTEQTSFSASTTVSQNVSFLLGDGGNDFRWGTEGSNNRLWYGGYLAEVNMIDGTSLGPDSFGETKNDIWIPKNTSGLTFGTNGYRLQFKQTGTGQDSSGIGADTSGNDVHFSVSALAASDVTIDSPTNNFAVQMLTDANGSISITEGGLKSQVASSGNYLSVGTNIGMKGGKYYFEYRGIRGGNNSTALPAVRLFPDGTSSHSSSDNPTGSIDLNCGTQDGDDGVYMVALDLDNGKAYRGRNGSWSNSGDPTSGATGTGNVQTLTAANLTSQLRVGVVHRFDTGTSIITFNFGQEGTFLGYTTAGGNADENGFGNFKYAPPSGYLAICTRNLPDPVATIDPAEGGSPQDYFNTVLRDGTGSGGSITGVGFQPDWYWEKKRNASSNHYMVDSVRGVTKSIFPNITNAEGTDTNSIQSFDTDGFTWGSDDRAADENLVVWLWKAGTAFSNDASATSVGSIDSAGSVNTDLGFSIINFTGTGNVQTIAHGLSKAPELIFQKSREKADNWVSYAAPLGNDGGLILEGNNSKITSDTYFNDTSPTSTVWTMGTQNAVNNSGEETIAYCFHSVENYSKIGSYTGNSDADGTFVYTGFRPAFVLIKNTGATESWNIFDTARDPSNLTTQNLNPNSANAESDASSGNRAIDILSNGFKLRGNNSAVNDGTFLYLTFSEQPFKYANAR